MLKMAFQSSEVTVEDFFLGYSYRNKKIPGFGPVLVRFYGIDYRQAVIVYRQITVPPGQIDYFIRCYNCINRIPVGIQLNRENPFFLFQYRQFRDRIVFFKKDRRGTEF